MANTPLVRDAPTIQRRLPNTKAKSLAQTWSLAEAPGDFQSVREVPMRQVYTS